MSANRTQVLLHMLTQCAWSDIDLFYLPPRFCQFYVAWSTFNARQEQMIRQVPLLWTGGGVGWRVPDTCAQNGCVLNSVAKLFLRVN